MPKTVSAQRPRTGRHGLLVGGLAVDDGGHPFLVVLADPLPNAHHVPAGGVDGLAAEFLKMIHCLHFRPESRHDHHILRSQAGQVVAFLTALEGLDAHFPELLVHLRVVDDLSQKEDSLVLKNLGGRISQVDRPLHPVTETERLRQHHSHILGHQRLTRGPYELHRVAAVMFFHLRLHRLHHLGSAEVYFFSGRGRSRGHESKLTGISSGSSQTGLGLTRSSSMAWKRSTRGSLSGCAADSRPGQRCPGPAFPAHRR